MKSKATALLLQDHKRLFQVLHILEEMAAGVDRDQNLDSTHVRELLQFLQDFGDRHHQGKEEEVLFPALLQGPAQKNYRELSSLIFEHHQRLSLVKGLEESISAKSTQEFVFYARRLSEIVRTHIQHEEDVLFPLVDSTLSPAEDERVVLQMKVYDGQWQERELPGMLGRLDALESAYAPKTREKNTKGALGNRKAS